MSEFVTLIEAKINPHHNDGLIGHAITICGNPQAALGMIHAAWPFTTSRIVHSVRSENRSELLYNAVRIKLAQYHYKFNWYKLSPDAVIWFSSITEESYVDLIRLVENQSAEDNGGQVRDVTKRRATGRKPQPKPEVPEMTPEEVDTLRQHLLASIG